MKGTVFPSSRSATVRSTLGVGRFKSRATCPRSIRIEFIGQTMAARRVARPRKDDSGTKVGRRNLALIPWVVKDYDDYDDLTIAAIVSRLTGSIMPRSVTMALMRRAGVTS